MEEADGTVADEKAEPSATGEAVITSSTPVAGLIEDAKTLEGLGLLQKVLFLAVLTGCIATYLRMSRVKAADEQGYEKSLA